MDDAKPRFVLDAAGIFWVAYCVTWTLLVAMGMAFLWSRRDMPMLKVRGLGLSFFAILSLHLYWMAVQMASVTKPFPSVAQYWIMGIYLPFGIALFSASNLRFLQVAKDQKRFIHGISEKGKTPATVARLGRLHIRFDPITKILGYIALGMVIQLILTVTMYLVSRKFHPSFGIPGTEVGGDPWEVNTEQTVGWEWWPSVVWQFFWSWIVAPIILWRARRIHDTLGWRTQTIACCLAGLPATPMWLVALYVPGMAPVNHYWIPPQWLAMSIMFLEIFSVFVPCWLVFKHVSLRQETLDAIAAWESRSKYTQDTSSSPRSKITSSSDTGSSLKRPWSLHSMFERRKHSVLPPGTSHSGQSLLSMSALERLLETNPEPLRDFSALKDFSGENVAFLAAVTKWKRKYPLDPEPQALREAYIRALGIYTEFISPHADFPVNISFQEFGQLEPMFAHATRVLYGDSSYSMSPVTPFAPPDWSGELSTTQSHESERHTFTPKGSFIELRPPTNRVSYWGEIPRNFSINIFDQAEKSVKYLVLTNTWPKFLQQERRSSGRSSDSYHKPLGVRFSTLVSCEA